MLTHIGIAIVTFAVTNVDDLLILSMYFADPRYKVRNIVVGQYLGVTLLVIVSLAGFVLGKIMDHTWISLLGILPLALGLKGLSAWFRSKDESEETDTPQQTKSNLQFLSVALVTIANGGDNIGVYAPLFATIPGYYLSVYLLVSASLIALWCLLSYWLVSHKVIRQVFSRYGSIILPVFLVRLGLFILKDFI
jgi:cadmium resistance protein CadD (predicted permease)